MIENNRIAAFIVICALQGCTFVSPRYTFSGNNLIISGHLAESSTKKIAIGKFTSFEPGLHSLACRTGAKIDTIGGQSYESYIQEALTSELLLSHLYDSTSSTILYGKLEYIDTSSIPGAGKWLINMSFNGPGVKPFKINSVYQFDTPFEKDSACQQVAYSLLPATQDLIGQVISHPSFQSLVQPAKSR